MREKLQRRAEELRNEFEKGQSKLRELQREQSQLHETLLRIGGAIQVLEELLVENKPEEQVDIDPIKIQTASSESI